MMHCEIVGDLLPLYADGCCSAESRRAVEAHLAACPDCRTALEVMGKPLPVAVEMPQRPARVNQWKASVLQSVLLFASFGIITLGVALEAASGFESLLNGFWAMAVVVPATGFLLSLANWYFVRLYRSRRSFSRACCGMTLGAILLCGLWALNHYEWTLDLKSGLYWVGLLWYSGYILLPVALCLLSGVLSGWYAKLLGKERL